MPLLPGGSMDAITGGADLGAAKRNAAAAERLPMSAFLARCHAEISADDSGHVADYIPELFKADPRHFGISLATIDGYVYETVDSAGPARVPLPRLMPGG